MADRKGAPTTRTATNPLRNPAVASELTMRERKALMDQDDWGDLLDVVLAPHRERSDDGR